MNMTPKSRMLIVLSVAALLAPLVDAFAFTTSSAMFRTHADSTFTPGCSLGPWRPSSPPFKSTTLTMMAKNRRERRYADGRRKKSGSKGAKQKPSAPTSDAKWLQVLDQAPDMGTDGVKVVSGKYKGEDKFFTLAQHGGNLFAVGEACGRCKFPMVNGKVKLLTSDGKVEDVKAGVEQDPDAEVAVSCPLCGAVFNLRTGAVAGEQPKGLAQKLVSKVVSQTPAESMTTHQVQALSTGAVIVRVD